MKPPTLERPVCISQTLQKSIRTVVSEGEEVVATGTGMRTGTREEKFDGAIVDLLLVIQLGALREYFAMLSGRPRVMQRRVVVGTHI